MVSLSTLDLSVEKTLHSYLRRCRLPVTPFTVYVLQSLFHQQYHSSLRKMTLQQIHAQGYLIDKQGSREEMHALLLQTLFPYVEKDVDVVEYNLGQPVSTRDVHALFLSTVEMSRVPKEQKQLLNAKNHTFLDVITLQETPLSEFVQLRDTGELVSRETLADLMSRHTGTWKGKENVGFKTPMGTMVGNLVLYNYDEKEFFPQKPGVLSITTIPNVENVPSELLPKKIIPDRYFKLEYKYHVSYLPDTPEGRVVLGLMKDAFKKGNLYGLSYSGRVRHGRIHKRTTLTGASFGYPDDTFLHRVSGELRALGSTPFLYQFSNDPSYEPGKDPYPEEKRFKITYQV